MNRSILIKLLKKQIVNDVSVQCNIIGKSLQRNPDTEEQGSDIMTPDDDMFKPVVARAITEGFGEVKRVCQRYLIMGRETDDNRLERINEMEKTVETITTSEGTGKGTYDLLAGTPYIIKIKSGSPVKLKSANSEIGSVNGSGVIEYTPSNTGVLTVETTSEEVELIYFYGDFGVLELELSMPSSFNLGMTETMKSCAHRMIVDYVMKSLLMNQWPEKAAAYLEQYNVDIEGLRDATRSRTPFLRNAADWS